MSKKKQYVIVSDNGVVGAGIKDPDVVLAMLLHAYLNVWNDEIFKIDIIETGKKIVDLMQDCRIEEDDESSFEDLLAMLLEVEDEDDDD